jgi:NTE family protein/lysophospholipid hydrolase
MESDVTAARRWLVILHPDGSRPPSGTRRWLGKRRLELHHHVRWDTDADFERLARFVRGRAIGLVLGGGGARGVAHFGAIRALVDSGVPIDVVGGTSLGGLIAPRFAMGKSIDEIERDGRDAFVHRRPHNELTLPIVSLISPRRMTRIARDTYGDARFEDLWLNSFCVACDISTGETVVLRDGPVWKAVLATSSLPGVSVPVVHGKRLLVDGGVVDNLPGAIMKKLCGGNVILVDVSPEGDLVVDYTEIPSASRILWSWLLPHRKPTRVPTIGEVLARATTVSSVRRRLEARRLATLVLSPPVERFGLLEFAAFDDIVEAGYRYAMDTIARWPGRGGDPSRGRQAGE